MELNEIRPFLFGTLELFANLSRTELEEMHSRHHPNLDKRFTNKSSTIFSIPTIPDHATMTINSQASIENTVPITASVATDTLFSFPNLE